MATPWRSLGGKCRLLMNAAAVTTTTKSSAAAATTTVKPVKVILKPVPISPILKDFMGGTPEASRTEAVKKVWEYIKLHNLQNPNDKREIICDQKLKTLFSGKDTVGFLEIARLLSQHFVKTG
ncbi:hypothetical protein RND81_12G209100 [Saponaria officinalis]|uniref:DM2 domain-containing protein n=1 Tax=Saponaria officinalis TaxID=3572 RepID=A0AAW1HDI4_SAPOF